MNFKKLVLVILIASSFLYLDASLVFASGNVQTKEFTRESKRYRLTVNFATKNIQFESLVGNKWVYNPSKQVEKTLEYPTKTYKDMPKELSKCPLKRGIYVTYLYQHGKKYPQVYVCASDGDKKSCALYIMCREVLSEVWGGQYIPD